MTLGKYAVTPVAAMAVCIHRSTVLDAVHHRVMGIKQAEGRSVPEHQDLE
jgi:hypothetical protein